MYFRSKEGIAAARPWESSPLRVLPNGHDYAKNGYEGPG